MLQDSGALPKEKGGIVRDDKAMHEANVLSCWLKEVGEDKKAREMESVSDTQEEVREERGLEKKRKKRTGR